MPMTEPQAEIDVDLSGKMESLEEARSDFGGEFTTRGGAEILAGCIVNGDEGDAWFDEKLGEVVFKAYRLKRPPAANDNKPGKAARPVEPYPGIVSSADLVRNFIPPDYLLDGVVQAGFLYSCTAMTGAGKTAMLLLLAAHTALGGDLCGREVKQGRVVYFAGENPDDVTMRWIGMAEHLPFDATDVDVHFITGSFSIPAALERIKKEVEELGGANLIVVDTSAAYFRGADENANTDLGNHARDIRALTTLAGSPCVIVACHPTKNPDPANLLPRGGGAFLAEVDGNLVLMKTGDGTVKLHWHGKHRGPDFDPLMFQLSTITAPLLVDSRGRDVPTVMAAPLTGADMRTIRVKAQRDEDDVLLEIARDGSQSTADMAERLGWRLADGTPHKRRATTATEKLKKAKHVTFDRGKWKVTKLGDDAVVAARQDKFESEKAARMASSFQNLRPKKPPKSRDDGPDDLDAETG